MCLDIECMNEEVVWQLLQTGEEEMGRKSVFVDLCFWNWTQNSDFHLTQVYLNLLSGILYTSEEL